MSTILKLRSGLEKEIYNKYLKGTYARYESIRIPFHKVHVYKPDFVLPNGIILEIKGKFTSFDRAKHQAVQKQHPKLDIRFVFGFDNKLHKNSATRYSDWCKTHNFLYAVNCVPQEWLDEPKKEVTMEKF